MDRLRFADLLHHRRASLERGDSLAPPIVPASTFHLPGSPDAHWQYGRFTSPTWEVAEAALAVLEQAPAVIFPSGMAAIASVLYGQLRSGDRVLLPADGYYTVRALAERFLAPLGIAAATCPTAEVAGRDLSGCRLVWLETPSNPGLELCDIAAAAQAAHDAGALLVVDNTSLTALGQRPLDLGADIVVAADTKAPGGHSDLVFGHVATRDAALLAAVRDWRKLAGAIPSAFDAWLMHRSLETLELRFERMCASALTIAPRLAAHPAVRSLRFPGLPDDPMHGLARRQMRRFGFVLAVTFADETAAERFLGGCRYLRQSTSFGGVATSGERRARWGDAVAPGFVRLSIGCEPPDELWAAMKEALDGI